MQWTPKKWNNIAAGNTKQQYFIYYLSKESLEKYLTAIPKEFPDNGNHLTMGIT